MKNKDRIKQLESEVAELKAQVAGMKQAFELLEQSRPLQPNPFWQVNPTPLPNNPLLPPYIPSPTMEQALSSRVDFYD